MINSGHWTVDSIVDCACYLLSAVVITYLTLSMVRQSDYHVCQFDQN